MNCKSFGLAGGIFWGVLLMIFTWVSMGTGYANLFFEIIANIYPGYSVSFWGSFIVFGYGFMDGFIALFVIAWLYNKFSGEKACQK